VKLRSFVPRLLDFTLPPACAGCQEHLRAPSGVPLAEAPRICSRCRSRLRPPPHPRCPRCHAPRGTGIAPDRPCPECHDWPAPLLKARAVCLLEPPADALVHGLKYGGWPELAGELGAWMVRVAREEPEGIQGRLVVPVPTTPRRLRQRGYNQARELAVAVAAGVCGTLSEVLSRRDGGGSQVTLHRGERRANVHEAFFLTGEARAQVGGRVPILVDDVLTTGATAGAAAEALAEAGAQGVFLLTFARTPPDPEAAADR
jgi:predicted amidophosphoribosyltransferase